MLAVAETSNAASCQRVQHVFRRKQRNRMWMQTQLQTSDQNHRHCRCPWPSVDAAVRRVDVKAPSLIHFLSNPHLPSYHFTRPLDHSTISVSGRSRNDKREPMNSDARAVVLVRRQLLRRLTTSRGLKTNTKAKGDEHRPALCCSTPRRKTTSHPKVGLRAGKGSRKR